KEQQPAKNAAKQGFGEMLRPQSAEKAAHQESQPDQQSRPNIHISGFVVLPKSQGAYRRQQRTQRRALRLVLAHVEEPDQRWNDHDTAAYANDSGQNSNCQSQYEIRKNHALIITAAQGDSGVAPQLGTPDDTSPVQRGAFAGNQFESIVTA